MKIGGPITKPEPLEIPEEIFEPAKPAPEPSIEPEEDISDTLKEIGSQVDELKTKLDFSEKERQHLKDKHAAEIQAIKDKLKDALGYA